MSRIGTCTLFLLLNKTNHKIGLIRDYIFMTLTRKGVGCFEICHMFADSIVFKQEVYC